MAVSTCFRATLCLGAYLIFVLQGPNGQGLMDALAGAARRADNQHARAKSTVLTIHMHNAQRGTWLGGVNKYGYQLGWCVDG